MQLTFGDAEELGKRKGTHRKIFLTEMEEVVPWKALLSLIEPHYPQMGHGGRQPYRDFLQQRYGLSDPALEEGFPRDTNSHSCEGCMPFLMFNFHRHKY